MRLRSTFVLLLVSLVWSASALAYEDQYFESDGVRIRYIVVGQGEPVLLIHGFAATIEFNWRTVIGPLSADHQVIALDCRGHGKSGKPHEVERYGQNMPEDVLHLLDHLKIEKAHIVGYSMGSFIAAKFVADHPERVLTVTLGGGAGAFDDPRLWNTTEATAQSLEQGRGIWPLIQALRPSKNIAAPSAAQMAFANTLLAATNDVKALACVIRGFRALVVPDEQVRKIDVPVQSIVGSDDPLREAADRWQKLLPSMEIDLIPHGDHLMTPMRPEFLKNLQDFLAAHSTAAAR